MSDFKFLRKYLVNSTRQSNSLEHVLYPESYSDIETCEKKLGYSIPVELKQLYEQAGYGFFWQKNKDSFDRLLSAVQVAQINLKEDFYESDPDLELYDDLYKDKLIFFEVNEGVYLAIDKEDKNDKNSIYFFEKKIYDSLEEFLIDFARNSELLTEISDQL